MWVCISALESEGMPKECVSSMELLHLLKLQTITATFGGGSLQLSIGKENILFGYLTLLIWKNIQKGERVRCSLGPQRLREL